MSERCRYCDNSISDYADYCDKICCKMDRIKHNGLKQSSITNEEKRQQQIFKIHRRVEKIANKYKKLISKEICKLGLDCNIELIIGEVSLDMKHKLYDDFLDNDIGKI